MIKIAICDDDELVIQQMEQILEKCAREQAMQLEFGMFYSGEELLRYMGKTQQRFDILFLDIEMGGLDGLKTAERIREIDRKMLIVYVTNHESYALKAYQVHPFHFLVKPLDEQDVRKCFCQACSYVTQEEEYFEYTYKKNSYRKPIRDIMYFMSNKRMIQIHMEDGTIEEFYGKLDDIDLRLQSVRTDFWRIHKSVLVNAKYIFRKTFYHVELTNGEKLNISKDRVRDLNALYVQNIRRRVEE